MGIGIIVVVSGRDDDGDIDEEERRELVENEESITITCAVDGVDARWIEMSTVGGEEATIS